ncbi:MAG: OmpA family protein [Bdellovibrionales bacterium]|nr:OmpA family protein [Bdellovibrionales bacterium]
MRKSIKLTRFVRCVFVVALLSLGAGCAEPPNKATTGTLAGSALGAGLGAIIGNQAGNTGAGIAIGAAGGALGGALIGNSLDSGDRANAETQNRIDRTQQQIDENRRLIEELKRRGADVHGSQRGVVVNLPDILFAFDSYELTGRAQDTIREIAEVVRGVQQRHIAVEGHTDSIGTVTYNKRLSTDRAQSVARALERNGVEGRRISVYGFGEGRPIATNNTDAGRARNRRVEVIIEN